MTTQVRQVLINLRGRIDPNFLRNVRSASAGLRAAEVSARGAGSGFEAAGDSLEGFAEDMQQLTRLQRTARTGINRITRQLRVQNRQLEGMEKGSDEYKRLSRSIETATRNLRRQRGVLADVEEHMDRLRRSGVAAQRAVRALGRASLASGAALGGAFALSVRAANKAVEERAALTRANANLSQRDAENLRLIEGRYKVTAAGLATNTRFLQREIGEFAKGVDTTTGKSLAKFGVSLGEIGATAGGSQAQFAAALQALSAIESETDQAAAANLLFGRSGQEAVKLLRAIGAEGKTTEEILAAIDLTPFGENEFTTLANAEGAWGEVAIAVNNAQQALALRFSPQVTAAGMKIQSLTEATTHWLLTTEGAPAIIAATAGGLFAAGGVMTGVTSKLAAMGEQAYFSVQGIAAMHTASSKTLGVVRRAPRALGAMAGGMRTVALGTWKAVAAAAAFAVTPVGLTIIGIAAAVATLTAGVVYLADRVGGFGNLWQITLDGAKAAFFTWAQGISLGVRPIFFVLDKIIEGVNLVRRGLSAVTGAEYEEYEFRFGALTAQLDAAAENARATAVASVRSGVAEGAAQQAAGTSVGQRLGGAFGFGGDAAAAPDMPALAMPAQAGATAAAPARAGQVVDNRRVSTTNYVTAQIDVTIAGSDDWERAGERIRDELLIAPQTAGAR